MAWLPLDNRDKSEIGPEFARKTRFLVDENLGQEVANVLQDLGYNVCYAKDVGLSGRSDEDVIAFAWREGRVLLTHDRDFLDGRFPHHRNPGVVVLAGGDGDQDAMIRSITIVVLLCGRAPEIWKRTKVLISAQGEITIRQREYKTGAVSSSRYRMTKGQFAEMWVDD